MNSIKSLSGLTSSLFLTAGLTRLAEKLDPMLQNNQAALTISHDAVGCEFTELPCQFTPEAGQ
ncbi:MAG: hypothetical protein PSW75_10570 [bacterium]|nr:hypothetical protein [bacterium]MDI1337402.1 hypothetical protein [Lacunisphaera sp.]